MFKELAPILQQRSAVIMVNPLEGDNLTVAIFPKKINDAENAGLSTPVSVTGTPEELDEQLPSILTQFVGAHLELKNTLELAKEEMARAAKAAKQESKSKTTPKTDTTTGGDGSKPAEKKTATQPAKPAQPKTPPPATTANLFDFGGAPSPAPAQVVTPAPAPAPAPAPTPAAVEPEVEDEDGSDDEEILAEIEEDGENEDELAEAA